MDFIGGCIIYRINGKQERQNIKSYLRSCFLWYIPLSSHYYLKANKDFDTAKLMKLSD